MDSLGWSTGETIWQAVFHSVSAFCNAGFSLNGTNLEGFRGSPATSIIIGSLIVMGGLGFMLLTVLGRNWLQRMKTGRRTSLPVQVRFVLLITGILIVLGWGFFLSAEWNNTLDGMSLWEKLGNSFLQGVTPRTAGFNTVPTASLLPQVKWFFVMLMFIGASPGGTGGGVKTTTIGLLFLSLRSLLQKRQHPEIWKRHIPTFDLQRAGAILVVGMAAFCLSSIMLIMTEHSSGNFSEMDYIFESMSAFGTVGLSTGVTSFLSTAGKWIIIVTMFIGRTAPATLAVATTRVRTSRYSYPESRITIG
jgi:trk system potassium uptake protein TrkH